MLSYLPAWLDVLIRVALFDLIETGKGMRMASSVACHLPDVGAMDECAAVARMIDDSRSLVLRALL